MTARIGPRNQPRQLHPYVPWVVAYNGHSVRLCVEYQLPGRAHWLFRKERCNSSCHGSVRSRHCTLEHGFIFYQTNFAVQFRESFRHKLQHIKVTREYPYKSPLSRVRALYLKLFHIIFIPMYRKSVFFCLPHCSVKVVLKCRVIFWMLNVGLRAFEKRH